MHRRMAVIAERDVPELHLRGHAHLMATQTMAQSTALTAQAAASRATTGMRRIDHDAGCGGCGDAAPWLWAWTCGWAWEWASDGTIRRCYIITLQLSTSGSRYSSTGATGGVANTVN